MADNYSQLELAPNQHTDPFPEVSHQGADAPERDLSADAPELVDEAWPLPVSRKAHLSLQKDSTS